jgi:hypothetical protein
MFLFHFTLFHGNPVYPMIKAAKVTHIETPIFVLLMHGVRFSRTRQNLPFLDKDGIFVAATPRLRFKLAPTR